MGPQSEQSYWNSCDLCHSRLEQHLSQFWADGSYSKDLTFGHSVNMQGTAKLVSGGTVSCYTH